MALGLRETTTAQDMANSTVVPDSDALEAQLLDGIGEASAAAPDAPQEEVRVVKAGDTLMGISQEVGVPLEQLARDNNIQDVNVIQPGQEIKFTKPGAADTDMSARPATPTDGININGETLSIGPEGTSNALGGEPEILGEEPGDITNLADRDFEDLSDVGTSTEEGRKGEYDPTEQAVVETPKLTNPPVDTKKEIVSKKVVEDQFDPESFIDQTNEEIAKLVSQTTITNDTALKIFDDAIGDIKNIKYPTTGETRKFYEDMAKKIDADVAAYDKAIDEVAIGEMDPTFTGFNKFFAVLGAAMGAYGSAMTGTPNFALNIMNKAIDADQKDFLATKAMRLKNMNQQRADALQRRATLVQLGINETDRMLQIAQMKIGKQSDISNIEAIKKGLIQQQEKLFGDWRLAQTQILATYALKKQNLQLTSGEKARTRQVKLPGGQIGIFGPTMSDKQIDKALPDVQKFFMGHGKLIGNSAAAEVLRETGSNADSIELAEKGIIGKLIEMVEMEPIAAKIGWTETGKKVKSLHTKLKNHYQKEIMGAGANLTGVEVEQVEKIVGDPTTGDILFGTYLTGLKNLQNQLDSQYANIIDIKDIKVINKRNSEKTGITGLKKFE